jgi:transmembrane sensor
MTDANDSNGEFATLRRDAWNWVLRITAGDATKADISQLERWCAQSPRHAEAFAQASKRWRSLGPAIENSMRRDSTALSGRASPAIGRRVFLGGALAVSAAGAGVAIMVRPPLGLWPAINELAADYRTAPGEQRQLSLADDISVEMNTRTSLNIRPAVGEGDRIELITGEAAVTTRSKPVVVMAESGQATAKAARFNVRCDGPAVRVTCLDGSVEVVQRGRMATVKRNEQVTYSPEGVQPIAAVDAAIVAGWREGDLYFRDEPLSRVIEEINRYRSGRILLMSDALGRRRFTARFKLDRLDVVVTQLQVAFGARVTSLPGGIVLIG